MPRLQAPGWPTQPRAMGFLAAGTVVETYLSFSHFPIHPGSEAVSKEKGRRYRRTRAHGGMKPPCDLSGEQRLRTVAASLNPAALSGCFHQPPPVALFRRVTWRLLELAWVRNQKNVGMCKGQPVTNDRWLMTDRHRSPGRLAPSIE